MDKIQVLVLVFQANESEIGAIGVDKSKYNTNQTEGWLGRDFRESFFYKEVKPNRNNCDNN
jgi:hypothetical protein